MFSAADLRAGLELHTPSGVSGYIVGLSGGADSAALLAAAAQLRADRAIDNLRAVHVDHGLQSGAFEFSRVCAEQCARLGIMLRILAPRRARPHGESIEAFARDLRYSAIAADMTAGECLLTAHHAEDQAETFLLQALRGAGIAGLAAMPALKLLGPGWHLRPLLHVERSDLREFGRASSLHLSEDPMNGDLRFDRAFLRREIWPRLSKRWPGAARALSRAAGHAARVQDQTNALSAADLAGVQDGIALSLTRLRCLDPARRVGVLRRWISISGARLPSEARLREAARQLSASRPDRSPATEWAGWALRRYRDRIYLTSEAPPKISSRVNWRWQDDARLDLNGNLGSLLIVEQAAGLDPSMLAESIQVRPRIGGERLRPGRAARTQSVQHLLQARGVPPWMRSAIPLLYSGEQLLGVGDFWLDGGRCVGENQSGVAFRWERTLSLD